MKKSPGKLAKVSEDMVAETGFTVVNAREWILSIMERVNLIARDEDLDGVIQEMLGLMMEINQAESALFFQIDPTTDELVITHVKGASAGTNLVGLRINRERGLPGLTICDTQLLVVGDLTYESDWLHSLDPRSTSRNRNVINLPVNGSRQALGVIQIFNFQRAELDMLKVLGDRLGLEMESRGNLDATRRSNQRLLSLVEMLGEVAGTLDRNQLLHRVTEYASRLVSAERSSIFLVDPNTREIIFQVAYQSEDHPVDPGQAAKAKSARGQRAGNQSIWNTRSRKESLSQPGQGEFSFFNRSAITVPLLASNENDRDHVFGGLMVLNKSDAVFQEEDAHLMRILASQVGTFLQVAEMYEDSGELFLGVIKALAAAIDAKDPHTQGHSQRVSDLSVSIARVLKLDETSISSLRLGSLFHDIGKIGIPDEILLKKGRINKQEIDYVQLHPQMGVNILSQVKPLEPVLPAIQEHHERLDGSGYPSKLKDRQISWMGRIVAVADVYDAMTSDRPYRSGMSQDTTLAYLTENAGQLFDGECVTALVDVLSRPPEAAVHP